MTDRKFRLNNKGRVKIMRDIEKALKADIEGVHSIQIISHPVLGNAVRVEVELRSEDEYDIQPVDIPLYAAAIFDGNAVIAAIEEGKQALRDAATKVA